jgi:hypothetical protein
MSCFKGRVNCRRDRTLRETGLEGRVGGRMKKLCPWKAILLRADTLYSFRPLVLSFSVSLSSMLCLFFCPEHGGNRFHWNIGNDLPDYMASYPRGHQCKNPKSCILSVLRFASWKKSLCMHTIEMGENICISSIGHRVSETRNFCFQTFYCQMYGKQTCR